jgi:hypothetical protein
MAGEAHAKLMDYPPMKTQIKIAYRMLIDVGSTTAFEKKVFLDSYNEFIVQTQSFDPTGQYKTWTELRTQFPKANLNVTYKTGFAIGLYLKELNNFIPDVADNLGQPISFETHRFEIVESDITDIKKHKIALVFQTPVLELNTMLGEYLVLSSPQDNEESKSFTLQMRPGISIVQYRQSETA